MELHSRSSVRDRFVCSGVPGFTDFKVAVRRLLHIYR